jgi:hypothetical protein
VQNAKKALLVLGSVVTIASVAATVARFVPAAREASPGERAQRSAESAIAAARRDDPCAVVTAAEASEALGQAVVGVKRGPLECEYRLGLGVPGRKGKAVAMARSVAGADCDFDAEVARLQRTLGGEVTARNSRGVVVTLIGGAVAVARSATQIVEIGAEAPDVKVDALVELVTRAAERRATRT